MLSTGLMASRLPGRLSTSSLVQNRRKSDSIRNSYVRCIHSFEWHGATQNASHLPNERISLLCRSMRRDTPSSFQSIRYGSRTFSSVAQKETKSTGLPLKASATENNLPTHNADGESAAARRRKMLLRRKRLKERQKMLERRKTHQQQKDQQQQQGSAVEMDLFAHSAQDIADFAAYLTRTFPSKPLQEVMAKLKDLMKNSTADQHNNDYSLLSILRTLLHATNPNRPAQIAILEFLLRTQRNPHDKHQPPLPRKTKTVPPDSGDDAPSEQDAIQTILAARQLAVANDLQWSQADRRAKMIRSGSDNKRREWLDSKSLDAQRDEARDFVHLLQASMPAKQYYSTLRLFQMYIASGVGSASPSDETDEVVDDIEDSDDQDAARETDADSAIETGRTFTIRNLSSHLAQRTGAHFFLIAEATASFFGMGDAVMEKVAKFNRAKQKWEKQILRNTKAMTELHQILLDSLVTDTKEGDEASEIDHGELSDEAQLDAIMNQAEVLLNQSAAKTDGDIVPATTGDQRFRRQAHLVYEVLQLREHVVAADNDQPSLALPPVDRMVFLDNLPIDITPDHVMELYSRCGDIASVTIYNQRPELDPGPLTPAKLRARRKKQFRLAGAGNRRWQRPRSPVYAQLIFADVTGYKACCIDELRIFGMIIQKHPIRSLRACDMTSLFVEDIPDKTFCTDFETYLNGIVKEGLFATAASGENRRAKIGSCEIKFPSFELAFEAYKKLLDSDMLQNSSDCAVHWMRTPVDADSWWRRKRGFD